MQTNSQITDTMLKKLATELAQPSNSSSTKHLSDDVISWFVGGALSVADADAVEQHLKGCPHCTEIVYALFEDEPAISTLHSTQPTDLVGQAVTIAQGIRRSITGWLDFSFVGMQSCQLAFGSPVLGNQDSVLSEQLPIAIQTVDFHNDNMVIRLNWIVDAPREAPSVVVENTGQIEFQWHRFTNMENATQMLELKQIDCITPEQLRIAKKTNQYILALQWDGEILRLQFLPIQS